MIHLMTEVTDSCAG